MSAAGGDAKGPARPSRKSKRPASKRPASGEIKAAASNGETSGAAARDAMQEPPRKPATARRSKRVRRHAAGKRPTARRGDAASNLGRLWRIGAVAGICMLTACVAAATLFVWMPGPGYRSDAANVEFTWVPGQEAHVVAQRLYDARLTRSVWLMRLYIAVLGDVESIEPGTHLLQTEMSPRTVLRRLRRLPGGATVKVVIPEGFDKFDIAQRLHSLAVCSRGAFLRATTDPQVWEGLDVAAPDVEGYLFPATYQFARNQSPRSVIRRLVTEANKRYARVFDEFPQAMEKLQEDLGWNRHSVIVLASVVEKEAAVAQERPIISSVFFNRLYSTTFRPKQRLQSDPTARYGCLVEPHATETCAGVTPANKTVTGPMVRDPLNRYSTYAHAGLPPGPICNPGMSSIRAVLAPAQTNYLYFVATGGGRHTFSETYGQHRNAIPRSASSETPGAAAAPAASSSIPSVPSP